MKNEVLFLIDVQNDFITGSLGNPAADAKMDNIVSLIKSKKWTQVICTRDTHPANYFQTREGRALPVAHCINGGKGWEIDDRVKSILPDFCKKEAFRKTKIFNKSTFGSFELAEYLHDHYGDGKDCIFIFAGFCTDICVISNICTARAACPEAEIVFKTKCCAGTCDEADTATIRVLQSIQVRVDEEI